MLRRILLALAASPALALAPLAAPPKAPGNLAGNYTVVPDLVYATVQDGMSQPLDLELDLYLPTSGGPHPLVVWIHGGGWESGNKSNPTAEPLANAGYAVASINYRLTDDAIWPAQLHDCKAAVRWLRANAGTYDLDPKRFGLWGASAGGHLALMTGVTNGMDQGRVGSVTVDLEGTVGGDLGTSSAVQAVAAWFPPTELLRMSQFPNVLDVDDPLSPEGKLLGAGIQTIPELTKTAGPLAFLGPEDPPMFLAHGSLDVVVPMDQSALVVEYARKTYGLDVTFDAVPDVGHGVSSFDLAEAQAFFDRVLLNLGSPSVFLTTTGSSFQENGAPGTAPSFTVTRTGSIASALEVRLAWGGTATVGSDVAALPQRVTIAPGSPTAVVQPVALDDAVIEGTETLQLSLRATEDYKLDPDLWQATLELEDDETVGGLPTITIATLDPTGTEGGDAAAVRLTRTGPTTNVLSVALDFSGDALRGTDYFEPGTTVLFPPGSATVDVGIVPVNDSIAEPSEIVVVEVPRSSQYAVAGTGEASVGILDDELASGLPILNLGLSDPEMLESGDAGRITVYATDVTGPGGTVNVTLSGNALAGVDYVVPAPPVLPAVGLVADADLTPIPDGLLEGLEEVVVDLQPLAGYHVGVVNRLRLLLEDDDVSPGPAPITLDMTSMTIGAPTLVSVVGGPGLAPFVVYASQDRAFFSLPILGYPVLILPVELLAIGQGALDLFGGANFVVPVPYDPVLVERQYHFQALVLSAPILLSNRVERVPVAR